MKSESDYLARAEGSADFKKKLSTAKSADDLVKLAGTDKNNLSHTMRTIAREELQRRGFPEWAVNSMLLGEPVCW